MDARKLQLRPNPARARTGAVQDLGSIEVSRIQRQGGFGWIEHRPETDQASRLIPQARTLQSTAMLCRYSYSSYRPRAVQRAKPTDGSRCRRGDPCFSRLLSSLDGPDGSRAPAPSFPTIDLIRRRSRPASAQFFSVIWTTQTDHFHTYSIAPHPKPSGTHRPCSAALRPSLLAIKASRSLSVVLIHQPLHPHFFTSPLHHSQPQSNPTSPSLRDAVPLLRHRPRRHALVRSHRRFCCPRPCCPDCQRGSERCGEPEGDHRPRQQAQHRCRKSFAPVSDHSFP